MSLDDFDTPSSSKRKSPAKVTAHPRHIDALAALLNRLERWEESNPVYREMCRAVDDRVTGRA